MAVPAFKHLTRSAKCRIEGNAYLSALDTAEISRQPQFMPSGYLHACTVTHEPVRR